MLSQTLVKLIPIFHLALLASNSFVCGQFASCPSFAASGSDDGNTQMLLHANGRDTRIAHGGAGNRASGGWSASDLKSLARNGFDLSKQTIIYLHAYTQSPSSPWLAQIRRDFDANTSPGSGHNFLLFDWSNYSRMQYSLAASWVPQLGNILAQFMNQMNQVHSYNATNFHLISYSLSTHIAGLAGRKLRQMNSSLRVGKITALDPTGVCFHQNSNFARSYALQGTDAQLVVARHYDMSGLGSHRDAIGGLDIYVNGGRDQPGQTRLRYKRSSGHRGPGLSVAASAGFGGSHARAAEHEAALSLEADDCQQVAFACSSWAAYLDGECASCGPTGNACYYIGNTNNPWREQTSYPLQTRMYLKTSASSPFCLHLYQVLVQLRGSSASRAKSLLKNGSIGLELNSGVLAVYPRHRSSASSRKYTALLSLQRALTQNELGSDLRVISNSDSDLKDFLRALKFVEFNYMSDKSPEGRASKSGKFCSGKSGSNLLVKC